MEDGTPSKSLYLPYTNASKNLRLITQMQSIQTNLTMVDQMLDVKRSQSDVSPSLLSSVLMRYYYYRAKPLQNLKGNSKRPKNCFKKQKRSI
jgi:hypothetical protein